MTEPVKRYEMWGHDLDIEEDDNGEWIKAEDYDRLLASMPDKPVGRLSGEYAKIGRVVCRFIDRMSDHCEEDPAAKILDEFVAAVAPIIDAALNVSSIDTAVPPVVIDRASPPSNCRQRLMANGCAYPRSGCEACGKFSPRWQECDAAMSAKP